MRKPILTPDQEAELAIVEAECKAAWPTATMGERLALTRKLSVYTYGCQHLTEEDHRIMSRFPVHTGPIADDDQDEDERWFANQAST